MPPRRWAAIQHSSLGADLTGDPFLIKLSAAPGVEAGANLAGGLVVLLGLLLQQREQRPLEGPAASREKREARQPMVQRLRFAASCNAIR